MSKNLRKKALSFGSMLGLALSGIVAMPAQAAPGDVVLLPDVGETWAVFNSDTFSFDIDYFDVLDDDDFIVQLTNQDGQAFHFEGGENIDSVYAVDAAGRVTDVTDFVLWDYDDEGVIDFDAFNAVRVLVTGIDDDNFYITPLVQTSIVDLTDVDGLEEWVAGDYDFEGSFEEDSYLLAEDSYDVYLYDIASFGDGDFEVGVQVWNEASDDTDLVIDTNWASDLETVSFYDPKNVTLTPRIERFVYGSSSEVTNTAGTTNLGYSVGFSKRVNLEQIDTSEFDLTVEFGSESSEFSLGNDLTLAGDSSSDDRARLYSIRNVATLVDGLQLDEEGIEELELIWAGSDDTYYTDDDGDAMDGDLYLNYGSVSDIAEVEARIEAEEGDIEDLKEDIAELEDLVSDAPADILEARSLASQLSLALARVALAQSQYREAEVEFDAYEANGDVSGITEDVNGRYIGYSFGDGGTSATVLDSKIAALGVLYEAYDLEVVLADIIEEDLEDLADKYGFTYSLGTTATQITNRVTSIETPVTGELALKNAALELAEDSLERLNETLELLQSIYTSILGVDIQDELAAGQTYRIGVQHGDAGARDRDYVSTRFVVPGGSENAADVTLTVGDAANSNQEDEVIDLRVGTKAYTYTAQLVNDADVAVKEAGVPVMLAIYATGWASNNASTPAVLSASGSNVEVTGIDGAMIATGVTNASGQVTFTITHSLAAAGDSYEINAYFADEDGRATAAGLVYEASYAATAPAEIEADNTVVAGANITITFTVTDQFGNPVSTVGTRALNVELTATDADDLELTAAVGANGKATFTFANFLAKGERDVLSASVFTGSGTTANYLGLTPALVELYNTADVASVEVAASANAVVTYSDFITGEGTAATRPANSEGTLYSGTVLDANGAGVAGAVVTVSANGFQFRKADSGNYATNSISVVADTNGQFSVRFWVHEANSTGKTLTVTSGGKTATTTVKSYLPEALSGANLSFSWTLPAAVVKNTTYAVVAKLTDKWGNPVSTTGSTTNGVTFQGTGSVEVNSLATPVARNFGKDGTVTVFLRSVKDVAGPGELTAVLAAADYTGTLDGSGTLTGLGAITSNNTATAWDETKWSRELSASIEVLDQAPVAGKVNVGSFNGKLVVYAAGLAGQTISWKVAGKWGKAVASSDYVRFDRPTARVGVDVIVEIYVNGVKQLTKTVRTR